MRVLNTLIAMTAVSGIVVAAPREPVPPAGPHDLWAEGADYLADSMESWESASRSWNQVAGQWAHGVYQDFRQYLRNIAHRPKRMALALYDAFAAEDSTALWREFTHVFDHWRLPRHLQDGYVRCEKQRLDEFQIMNAVNRTLKWAALFGHNGTEFKRRVDFRYAEAKAFACDYGCGQTIHPEDLVLMMAAVKYKCGNNAGYFAMEPWKASYGYTTWDNDNFCWRRRREPSKRLKCKHY
ncbi:hypothetical protein EJ05DRAFT_86131 [Pseudovirgaria hyperparasitica]|uniref:Uncharacterized protein n=1 Tax=Pseudovirgaria hyperparasitica TaxID=470096 RepID=A0A6A6W0E5_9PEZI|nr:uncharacterized protein EJ05DRAFT_86131 [Pseudovirgaria hyperparasitica]KAF2756013.1 hypothetical protein EJ05DRAFT_86131 [Pseudovirgaria hyperparasitica]